MVGDERACRRDLLAEHVDRVLVGFEDSRRYYKHPNRVEVTGTPVRGEFGCKTKEQAKAELGIPAGEKLVVSVWGSLGAGHMNEVLTEMIPMLDGRQGFRLLHAAGSRYYAGMAEELREYIYDMPRVMTAADLVVCRAGASTISELCYMGKPVIIVPSPNVTNNHQEKNARVLEEAGGAKVLLEGEFDAQSLLADVKELLSDDEKLSAMSAAMTSLAAEDATERICGIILDTIHKE